MAPGLDERLDRALRRAVAGDTHALDVAASTPPRDRRDALQTLLRLHALHRAPLEELAGAEWFQHHPAIAALKMRLERRVVADLDDDLPRFATPHGNATMDAIGMVRRLATADLVPAVYEWLATAATMDDVVEFLALEGGPDGGFDDLVATAQVGIDGAPKVTLAANYWDEMGGGVEARVHTELHRTLQHALGIPRLPPASLSDAALQRSVLNGILTTNRAYQPELLGALGVLELQAGPRCRRVLAALERLDAPASAFAFYAEHATTDPRHGKEWLARVLAPLAARRPAWGPRFARGAAWRCAVNDALFAELGPVALTVGTPPPAP